MPLSNGGLGGPAAGAGVLPGPPSGPITGAALGELVRKFKRLQNGSDIRGIALEGEREEAGGEGDCMGTRLHGACGMVVHGERSDYITV